MTAQSNLAEALARIAIGDRCPLWWEYEAAAPCEQRAMITRWREIAELGRGDKSKICDANMACNLLRYAGRPVSFQAEIDAGMKAREIDLRALPWIDIDALGNDYATAQRKLQREHQRDYDEDQADQFLGGVKP